MRTHSILLSFLLVLLTSITVIAAPKLPKKCTLEGGKRKEEKEPPQLPFEGHKQAKISPLSSGPYSHKIDGTSLTLVTTRVDDASTLDPTSSRMCLLDALRLLCSGRTPSQEFTDGAIFERPEMSFELEGVIATVPYPKMTWDEACLAARGVLDMMERSDPYYVETTFFVYRKRNLIATGHVLVDGEKKDGEEDSGKVIFVPTKREILENVPPANVTELDESEGDDDCVLNIRGSAAVPTSMDSLTMGNTTEVKWR